MSVQIGLIIKKVMEDKKISPSELASRLGIHPGSVSRIFRYRHIHTSTLHKISQALEHDFFKYFSQEIKVEKSEFEKQIEEYKKQIELLRKENGYLKQINELLINKQRNTKPFDDTSHNG
jgi:transcriptional regulator with XRE-family HTH domain